MSTDNLANQVPINNTVVVTVKPGNETGLYHILFSNLRWQSSWQKLKDHVRLVCSAVERVEVFPTSTCGWVAVRGYVNYVAAMKLLSDKTFDGRPLWVDGRNADQEVPIRVYVSPSEMSLSSPQPPCTPRTTPPAMLLSISTPPMMSPAASNYTQWQTSASESIISTPGMDYGFCPMSTPLPYDYASPDSWYQHDNIYADHSPAVPIPMYANQYDAAYQYPQHFSQASEDALYNYPSPPYNMNDPSGYASMSNANPTESHNVVIVERRKIFIKGLASHVQEDQVRELLWTKCRYDKRQIQSINVPQGSSGNRGYATVTFTSEDDANRAIKKLDKSKFEHKTLNVRTAKEGVSRNEDGRIHHSSRHQRDDRDRREIPKSSTLSHEKKDSSRSSGSSSEKKDRSVRRDIVIANGSSKRAGDSSRSSRS